MPVVSVRRFGDSSALFEFLLDTVTRVSDDLRELVRRTITDREPIGASERDRIDRFLAEFDRLDDPFDRTADPVHVTGSAIVVGERGVVLLQHKRLKMWLQPGGHLDGDEAPWEAARREACEETGLDLDFVDVDVAGLPALAHVDVHPAAHGHTHLDLRYLLGGDDRDPDPPADESQLVEWLSWSAAIERAGDPRLTELLAHLHLRFR